MYYTRFGIGLSITYPHLIRYMPFLRADPEVRNPLHVSAGYT